MKSKKREEDVAQIEETTIEPLSDEDLDSVDGGAMLIAGDSDTCPSDECPSDECPSDECPPAY